MPSRKFSVNSQFSSSSQKTVTSSSSSTGGCRRAASMHQINELYSAINELINTSPPSQLQKSGSSASHGSCSSESHILDSKQPGTNTRHVSAKPVRSTSNVSSKSCFASLATTKGRQTPLQHSHSTNSGKNRSIYTKLVSRFRGKKSRDKWSEESVKSKCIVDGKPVQSIDDLLDLMSSQEIKQRKGKQQKLKTLPRKKANSFDSFESSSSIISVHEVSSKLRSWHTWAASFAANQEDEARLRTESSLTDFIEEPFENEAADNEPIRPICFVAGSDDSNEDSLNGDQGGDFDASSVDALNTDGNEVGGSEAVSNESAVNKEIENELSVIQKFQRKISLKPMKSDSELRISCSKPKRSFKRPCIRHRHSDLDARAVTNQDKQNESRGLASRLLNAVFTGRSVSCEQINKLGESRIDSDISKQKVQQWLADLCRETGPKFDKAKPVDIKMALSSTPNPPNNSEISDKASIDRSVDVKIDQWPTSSRNRLPSQPLFYIPNIENEENDTYLRMIVKF